MWRSKRQFFNLENNNESPVYFTERLPPNNPNILNLARNQGITAVTNDCEVQLIVLNENGGVTFRPVYSSKHIEQLKGLLFKCKIRNPACPVSIRQLMEHVYPVLMVNLLSAISLIENGHVKSSTGYTPEGKSVNCKE